MSEPELAVIVPFRGGDARVVRQLVAALARQTLDTARFETVIVDDGSPEPLTLDPAPGLRMTVLRQPARGPAAARNLALARVTAPLVLFLNADAVPAPELLAGHLAAHAASPEPAAVLGRFDWLPEHRTAFTALIDRLGVVFNFDALTPGSRLTWDCFWTGNLSAPRAAVLAAGGFDERFPRAIWEDLELGFRLAHAGPTGLPLVFRPELRAGHDHALGFAAWLERAAWLGAEWVRFARLHGGRHFPILGGADEPDATLTEALIAALLAQQDEDVERQHALGRLLEGAGPDDAPRLLPEAEPLVMALHTMARMRGILAALEGLTPPEQSARAQAFRRATVVHTLLSDVDPARVGRLLDVLPATMRLAVTHTRWVAPGSLPSDPRLTLVRTAPAPATPATPAATPWSALLAASPDPVFVFVDGTTIPTTRDLRGLVRSLGASTAIGAVGLARHMERRTATAAVTHDLARFPRGVVAVPRDVLERDPGGDGELLDRIRKSGKRLAVHLPAGA